MPVANTVKMPLHIVRKFIEIEHELEDWLLSQDKEFLRKMRRARKDDLRGRFIPWKKAKERLGLE